MKWLLGVAVLLLGACTAGQSIEGDLAAAIVEAKPGSILELGSKEYIGSIVIDKPLTLVGVEGSVISASDDRPAISIVDTDNVTLTGLTIRGGSSGILVQRAEGVKIENVTVERALWHGIVAQDSEIAVTDCLVTGLRAPTPQGVEIINSDRHPPSLVRGCRIEGPVFEGLVAHVSHVTFEDNEVVGSTARGVVITEMSDGEMVGNIVSDSVGNAFFCGDMSNCSIVENVVDGIGPGGAHRSAQGHGVVVQYHSSAYIDGLEVSGVVGESVLLMLDSKLLDTSPYP